MRQLGELRTCLWGKTGKQYKFCLVIVTLLQQGRRQEWRLKLQVTRNISQIIFYFSSIFIHYIKLSKSLSSGLKNGWSDFNNIFLFCLPQYKGSLGKIKWVKPLDATSNKQLHDIKATGTEIISHLPEQSPRQDEDQISTEERLDAKKSYSRIEQIKDENDQAQSFCTQSIISRCFTYATDRFKIQRPDKRAPKYPEITCTAQLTLVS